MRPWLVLLFAIAAPGCVDTEEPPSTSTPPPPAPPALTEVAIVAFAFTPDPAAATALEPIVLRNQGFAEHEVLVQHNGTVLRRIPLAADAVVHHTFGEPGTYRLACGIHTTMRPATVEVAPAKP